MVFTASARKVTDNRSNNGDNGRLASWLKIVYMLAVFVALLIIIMIYPPYPPGDSPTFLFVEKLQDVICTFVDYVIFRNIVLSPQATPCVDAGCLPKLSPCYWLQQTWVSFIDIIDDIFGATESFMGAVVFPIAKDLTYTLSSPYIFGVCRVIK